MQFLLEKILENYYILNKTLIKYLPQLNIFKIKLNL